MSNLHLVLIVSPFKHVAASVSAVEPCVMYDVGVGCVDVVRVMLVRVRNGKKILIMRSGTAGCQDKTGNFSKR